MIERENNERFILYIDILGFKDLVGKGSIEEIYKTVNNVLESFYKVENNYITKFSVIYFSDTIVLYQDKNEDLGVVFSEIWHLAEIIYCKLLSIHIPIRAIITYGEFIVKQDLQNKNTIFFGKALIEAYEIEKNENWIGIISTCSTYSNKLAMGSLFTNLHKYYAFLVRKDNCLMMNPFQKFE